jgi:hypothetical protein
MTVELFAKWLLDNFPHDAMLVTTNGRAWKDTEVERVKAEDLHNFFFLKEEPTMNDKPVKKPCLVIFDEDRCDY